MACGATLKRTMDFDPLLSPASPKRRRCAPMSPSPSPQKYLRMEPSPFGRLSSALTADTVSQLKRGLKRLKLRYYSVNSLTFFFVQFSCGYQCHEMLSGCLIGWCSSPSRREQPLFTLKQVGMICERLLKEREEKVREEYDQILTTKLAEQYDAFVKFTHDQLMRRFGEQPAKFFVSLLFPADQWCLSVLVSHECCCSADVS
uniref:Akirin-2 n=1 Tax=Sinocyclocheilus grahami TaxID=75366 RepID=A0A672NY72_SINGR